MKNIGLYVLAIAFVWMFTAFSMDTSVAVSSGGRVHNIGLMNEKENNVIGSCILLLAGILLYLFRDKLPESNKHVKPHTSKKYVQPDIIEEDKLCPECKTQNHFNNKTCTACDFSFENFEKSEQSQINWDLIAKKFNK